jgi:soluble lytic murein transglycosylase-like protein
MSQEASSGWLCAAIVVLACYTALPETLVYHQTRLLRAPIEPSRGLIEAEVDRAAKAYQLHPKLLHALVKVESGYRQQAVSPVGARGLSQVMPANYRRCGLKDAGELFDPVSNLRCGALILRQEIDRLGSLRDALTVYNCGRVQCREGKQYAQKVINLFTAKG